MAKKLQFPKRRHTRLDEDTDKKLMERSNRLKVTPGVAVRLSLEQSLELPDPEHHLKEEQNEEIK
jgi:hypothetical protein